MKMFYEVVLLKIYMVRYKKRILYTQSACDYIYIYINDCTYVQHLVRITNSFKKICMRNVNFVAVTIVEYR